MEGVQAGPAGFQRDTAGGAYLFRAAFVCRTVATKHTTQASIGPGSSEACAGFALLAHTVCVLPLPAGRRTQVPLRQVLDALPHWQGDLAPVPHEDGVVLGIWGQGREEAHVRRGGPIGSVEDLGPSPRDEFLLFTCGHPPSAGRHARNRGLAGELGRLESLQRRRARGGHARLSRRYWRV